MSSATALTIIAVSVGVLAVLAILAVVFLMRLVLHLIAFEKTLTLELSELRQLAGQLRETTERVGQTVHDVQTAARRVGGAVGTVASVLAVALGRSSSSDRPGSRLRPWLTGASLGLSLIRRRQQHKKKNGKAEQPPKKKSRKTPKHPVPTTRDSSLTL